MDIYKTRLFTIEEMEKAFNADPSGSFYDYMVKTYDPREDFKLTLRPAIVTETSIMLKEFNAAQTS